MKSFTLLYYTAFVAAFIFSVNSNAQTSAIYDITFNSTWNAVEHTSTPSNAHWSNLVGATHKNENEFFELGQNASLGIKDIAEFGSNGSFMNEVQNSINTKEWLNASFNPFAAISSATLINIEFTEEHHLLSLASMVAPSPDWFIGINSLDLRNATNTAWKDSFTIDVFAYDSGTDSGTNYNSNNSVTSPVQPITMVTGFPINGNKIGELVVTFKSATLSSPEFETISTLKLFPNPSKGNLSIIGESLSELKSIEIYNILGSKVKNIAVSATTNRFNVNLSNLNRGVYLVKLNDQNGNSNTQKLILQ